VEAGDAALDGAAELQPEQSLPPRVPGPATHRDVPEGRPLLPTVLTPSWSRSRDARFGAGNVSTDIAHLKLGCDRRELPAGEISELLGASEIADSVVHVGDRGGKPAELLKDLQRGARVRARGEQQRAGMPGGQ
jgi:hypothetical protein